MSTALIRKGTVMGSLIPVLFVSVPFGFLAYLFKDVAILWGIPTFSLILMLLVVYIMLHCLHHYSTLAKSDADRLQSERFQMHVQKLQVIAAKSLPEALSSEALPEPSLNPVTSPEHEHGTAEVRGKESKEDTA